LRTYVNGSYRIIPLGASGALYKFSTIVFIKGSNNIFYMTLSKRNLRTYVNGSYRIIPLGAGGALHKFSTIVFIKGSNNIFYMTLSKRNYKEKGWGSRGNLGFPF